MSSYSYVETVARLRAECEKCAADAGRPEHVSLLSWHEWGHCYEDAPNTAHPHCRCGTELKSSPRSWHCGECHETFAGEKPFTRHRRGPGGARECADLRNDGPSQHWSDERGVWHYGPGRDVSEARRPSGAIISPLTELTA